MKYLVDSKEMKQLDKNTIEYFGIPSLVLMERAALSVYGEIKKRFGLDKHILIICGAGNNGGDGLAIARLLFLDGYFVHIYMPMHPAKMTEETKCQYQTGEKYGIPIVEKPEMDYDIIIDALFGIGLSRPLEGEFKELIGWCNKGKAVRIAVDMPSGISADTGAVLGEAFLADMTVTFGFAKAGQMVYPGAGFCGKLIVADIGIDDKSMLDTLPSLCCLEDSDISEKFPKRKKDSHKGSFGKVLVIAGSNTMAGAAWFSGKGAYLSGCGLVEIFTPEKNRDILLTKLPEAIVTDYSQDSLDVSLLREKIDWADVILAGPGIGLSHTAEVIIKEVLSQKEKPVVLDADGLNIIAANPSLLKKTKADVVITPHLGEMSRLTGREISQIKENLIHSAKSFAEKYHVVCVLKDARTVIASQENCCINPTGCNGMASGGSGDVLSGLIAGILAQNKTPMEAAALGAYIHGKAGEDAARLQGNASMLASDILNQIPQVIKELTQEGNGRIDTHI